CENLKALDSAIQHLTSLEKLEISFCDKEQYLPNIMDSFPMLQVQIFSLFIQGFGTGAIQKLSVASIRRGFNNSVS
ncbi:hypothetical protein F8388_016883, partial [Cannabis sativa]